MKTFYFLISFLLIISRGIFSQVIPTDDRFGEQWYLYHQSVPQNQRADIRAPEAWAITTGDPNIKIAIIEGDDGEPNAQHTDLMGRVTTHNSIILSDHATSVAGLIVAKPYNNGIVGLNWSSPLNSYSFSDITENFDDRIRQAKNDGNKIISVSQGSTESLGDANIELVDLTPKN